MALAPINKSMGILSMIKITRLPPVFKLKEFPPILLVIPDMKREDYYQAKEEEYSGCL